MTLARNSGDSLDVAVVGGGHNSLVAAILLARGGLRVGVFEQRATVGGFAAVPSTGEPRRAELSAVETSGWAVTEAAQDFGLLRADLVDELGLVERGLSLSPRPALGALLQDGELEGVLWADSRRLLDELPASVKDRAQSFLVTLPARLRALDELLGRQPSLAHYGALVRSAELSRLITSSAEDVAREAFGDTPHAVALATAACSWTASAPSELGTGLLLLLQLLGSGTSVGEHGSAEGALGALRSVVSARGLSSALESAALDVGVVVETSTPVVGIRVRGHRVRGLEIARPGGERLSLDAGRVLSGVDARRTLLDLVGARHLRVDEMRATRAVRYRGGCARFVYAATDLTSRARDLLGEVEGVRLFPHRQLEDVERALDPLRSSEEEGASGPSPWLELTVYGDEEQGAAGVDRNRATVVVIAHGLPHRTGEQLCEKLAPAIADTVRRHLAADQLSEIPTLRRYGALWEDRLGATNGDGFQGVMSLEQMFALRPLAHLGSQRRGGAEPLQERAGWPTSIEGLDFCGAAAHPGGYVTGRAGRLAALRILRQGSG